MYAITRFGEGSQVYRIPYTGQLVGQSSMSDNFRQLLTRTRRLPGTDGGYDELGNERSLSEVGSVRADWLVEFTSKADAVTQRNAIAQMQDWGVQRLFMQPTDPLAAERWCWARVDSINMSDNVQAMPHLRIDVSVTWQVSDPFWYDTSGIPTWGGTTWNGSVWGGTPTTCTGLATTLSITNSGNVYTVPTISIRPAAGKSCIDPIVRRIVNGEIVDEVAWYGKLNALDTLWIDCKKYEVRLNSVAQYNNAFKFRHADWMRLPAGSSSLSVKFAFSTDEASVLVTYPTRYV